MQLVDKDRVRFKIGDTNPDDFILTDDEISVVLAEEGSIYAAASVCCMAIAGKYARKISRSVGGLQASCEQMFNHYSQLAVQFSKESRRGAVSPVLFGYTPNEEPGASEPIFGRKGVHDA